MLDFEVFKERGQRVMERQPLITIQKKGIMTLNEAAFEALGAPQAVELLYAPQARTVGVRAVEPSLSHAYTLRKPARGRTRIVAAAAFLKHYDIQIEAIRRIPARMVGDILAADLTQHTADEDSDHEDAEEQRRP